MGFGQEPIPGMDDSATSVATAPSPSKQRTWRLKILNGPKAGSKIDIGNSFQIAGRNDPPSVAVDIDLTDAELGDPPMLSRRHVALAVVDGNLQVKDLASTNGTFLNGERLLPEEVHTVKSSGIRLRLANLDLDINHEDD